MEIYYTKEELRKKAILAKQDSSIKEELAENLTPFLKSEARRFKKTYFKDVHYIEVEDLFSQAYIGLLRAIENYDDNKSRDKNFWTYLRIWIKGRIFEFTRTKSPVCSVPIRFYWSDLPKENENLLYCSSLSSETLIVNGHKKSLKIPDEFTDIEDWEIEESLKEAEKFIPEDLKETYFLRKKGLKILEIVDITGYSRETVSRKLKKVHTLLCEKLEVDYTLC